MDLHDRIRTITKTRVRCHLDDENASLPRSAQDDGVWVDPGRCLMSESIEFAAATFSAAALTASQVGTWERSPGDGTFRADPIAASIFGLSDEEAERGAPLTRVRAMVHPDDLHLFEERVALAGDHGGLMLMEYRIVLPSGVERWVLVRGHYEAIREGDLIAGGRGIVLDVTASNQGAKADGGYLIVSRSEERGGNSVDRAAEHAIALLRATRDMGALGDVLMPSVELILLALGRQLARQVTRDMH